MGPSGRGKSTLLRMTAGLEAISGGVVRIGGRVVNDLRPWARDVARVFRNDAPYPHMSVAENTSFSPRLRRLARAAVDAKLRVQMRTEIKELHQRIGTTTIYVTHDQVEAMTMADAIVVMRDGAIEQAGGPLELFDRPANVFVAGFLGSPAMNLVSGRVAPGGFLPDGGPLLPCPAAPGATTLGIRPEHLRIDPGGVEATVAVVEPLGSETLIVARLGRATLTCLVRDRVALRPGEAVRLLPDLDKLHLFDERGRRCGPAPGPGAG